MKEKAPKAPVKENPSITSLNEIKRLLWAVIILLSIIIVFDFIQDDRLATTNRGLYAGFELIYDRLGRMRVY